MVGIGTSVLGKGFGEKWRDSTVKYMSWRERVRQSKADGMYYVALYNCRPPTDGYGREILVYD